MTGPDKPTLNPTTTPAATSPKKKTLKGYVEVGLILAGMSALFIGIVVYTLSYH